MEKAALAREAFAGEAAVTISHPEIPGVRGARCVQGPGRHFLARRLRVPLGSVLAIGDQWNDYEMIAMAGHGTAMPTAPPASARRRAMSPRHWRTRARPG